MDIDLKAMRVQLRAEVIRETAKDVLAALLFAFIAGVALGCFIGWAIAT